MSVPSFPPTGEALRQRGRVQHHGEGPVARDGQDEHAVGPGGHLGLAPDDAKAMPSIGAGVVELRIWDEAGTFRVVYVAKLADAVYVLHCFKKKSTRGIETPKPDMDLIRKRLDDAKRLAEGE